MNKCEIEESCENVDTGSVEPENNLIEEEKQKKDRLTLFSLVFNEKHIVKIPTAWHRRDTEDGDTPVIEFTQSTSRKIKDEIRFISSKHLIFYYDMQVHAEVLGLKLDLKKIGFSGKHVSSVQELEKLIEMFDNVKVCSGCASPNSIGKVETSFAIEDLSKCLRHLNCSLVLPKNSKRSCCLSCKNGKKCLAQKIVRLKKYSVLQRIRLKVSPPKEKKLQLLKKKFRNSTRQKTHFAGLFHHYKDFLQKRKNIRLPSM